jgi:hypothetical protein
VQDRLPHIKLNLLMFSQKAIQDRVFYFPATTMISFKNQRGKGEEG